MSYGARDRLLVFKDKVETGRDGLNAPTYDVQEVTRAWASKRDLSDAERVTAGMELSERVARFVMASTATLRALTAEAVFKLDGQTWDIKGAKDIDRRDIEITAKRRSD